MLAKNISTKPQQVQTELLWLEITILLMDIGGLTFQWKKAGFGHHKNSRRCL